MRLATFISTVSDGNMLDKLDQSDAGVIDNRQAFLDKAGVDIASTTRISTTYDTGDFRRYLVIDDTLLGNGMLGPSSLNCDALVTTIAHNAIFLPIADCLGVAIFDSSKNILMLSHLGRHHLTQEGALNSIEFLKQKFNSNPVDLLLTFSPSAGMTNYPLFSFGNRSISEVAVEQFTRAGVIMRNISLNEIDVCKNLSYYSHSEFLKGNREQDGRFAIVTTMTE